MAARTHTVPLPWWGSDMSWVRGAETRESVQSKSKKVPASVASFASCSHVTPLWSGWPEKLGSSSLLSWGRRNKGSIVLATGKNSEKRVWAGKNLLPRTGRVAWLVEYLPSMTKPWLPSPQPPTPRPGGGRKGVRRSRSTSQTFGKFKAILNYMRPPLFLI